MQRIMVVLVVALIGCGSEPVPTRTDATVIAAPTEEPTPALVVPTPVKSVAAPTLNDTLDMVKLRVPEVSVLTEAQQFDLAIRVREHQRLLGQPTESVVEEWAEVSTVVMALQPAFRQGRMGGAPRALNISWDLYDEAARADQSCVPVEKVQRVNPFVVAAMAHRESSFMEQTERGYELRNGQKNTKCRWCRGSRGEKGMFQFMPTRDDRPGFVESMMPDDCADPFDRRCSIRTVVSYLSDIRCVCYEEFGDRCSMDVIVASYGRDLHRLVAPESARHHRGVRNARAHLAKVDPSADEHWPTEFDDEFALGL